MRLTFSSYLLLFENKDEYLIKNFGEKLMKAAQREQTEKPKSAEEIIAKLKIADPKGKNLVWIARMYANEQFRFEDLPHLRDELHTFEVAKRNLPNKDLNSYKTLVDLYMAIDNVSGKSDDVAKLSPERLELLKDIYENDVEWIVNKHNPFGKNRPQFYILVPKTPRASIELVNKEDGFEGHTRWCTGSRDQNRHDNYKHDTLFCIIAQINGKKRMFQLHYATNQFTDEMNVQITNNKHPDILSLSKYPEWLDFLNKCIKRYFG